MHLCPFFCIMRQREAGKIKCVRNMHFQWNQVCSKIEAAVKSNMQHATKQTPAVLHWRCCQNCKASPTECQDQNRPSRRNGMKWLGFSFPMCLSKNCARSYTKTAILVKKWLETQGVWGIPSSKPKSTKWCLTNSHCQLSCRTSWLPVYPPWKSSIKCS